MSERTRDPLDEALASLPRDAEPARDLWPGILAAIEASPRARKEAAAAEPAGAQRSPAWFRLAAAVLLVVGSSFTTYVLMRESQPGTSTQIAHEPLPAPAVSATPASFGFGRETLGPAYVQARAELDTAFQARLAALPPAARAKVERNLADLRQAASEISATLAEHPSDPLLQELLMSTYHSELRLLADVSELPTAGSMRADL